MPPSVITPRPDGLVFREQAAQLCGVTPQAITNWAGPGYIALDGSRARLRVVKRESGRPLYDPVDLAKAELATRARARRGEFAVS